MSKLGTITLQYPKGKVVFVGPYEAKQLIRDGGLQSISFVPLKEEGATSSAEQLQKDISNGISSKPNNPNLRGG